MCLNWQMKYYLFARFEIRKRNMFIVLQTELTWHFEPPFRRRIFPQQARCLSFRFGFPSLCNRTSNAVLFFFFSCSTSTGTRSPPTVLSRYKFSPQHLFMYLFVWIRTVHITQCFSSCFDINMAASSVVLKQDKRFNSYIDNAIQ